MRLRAVRGDERGRRAARPRTAGDPGGSRRGLRTTPGTPARRAAPQARPAPTTSPDRRRRRRPRAPATPPRRGTPRVRRPPPCSRRPDGGPARGPRQAPARRPPGRPSRPSGRSRARARGASSRRETHARSPPARPAAGRAASTLHRVLAAEPGEPAGEERLEREVPPVLLADDDDERRPVHPRRRERADRIPEPRRRVQQHERGLAAADRPAGREPDHRALVEPEHELEVAGEPAEEGDLGRAGVSRRASSGRPAAQDVERRVADEPARSGPCSGARRRRARRRCEAPCAAVYNTRAAAAVLGTWDDRAVTDPADLGVGARPRRSPDGRSPRASSSTPASRASANGMARTATTATRAWRSQAHASHTKVPRPRPWPRPSRRIAARYRRCE